MLIAIIQLIVGIVVLGFLYLRMMKREVPDPIGKKQAYIPVLFGLLSAQNTANLVLSPNKRE